MEKCLPFKKLSSPFAGYFFSHHERRACIYDYFTPTLSVNGFTIYLQCFDVFDINDDCTDAAVYMIRPNHSPYWFVFRNLDSAREFCYLYTNNHTGVFWYKHLLPMFLFSTVVRLTMEMIPNVAFIDPDLPF